MRIFTVGEMIQMQNGGNMTFNEFANQMREMGFTETEIDKEWKEYQEIQEEFYVDDETSAQTDKD